MTPGPDMEQDPQLAAIYRAVADAGPPAHLDDAIRAAARREVAAGPRRHGLRRWSVPLSLAAVIVLSVTVVTMMREQGVDRLETMTLPQPVEIPAVTAQREAAGPPPVALPVEPVAKAEAPAPDQPLGRAAETERGVAASGSEPRTKVAAAEGTRAETIPAESTRAEDNAIARRDSAAPPGMLRSAPAPLADTAAITGALPRSAVPATTLSVAPAKSALLWQDLIREPPEKWIQRITELRRAGKTADADTLATEFRRRFPGERLPEDLR